MIKTILVVLGGFAALALVLVLLGVCCSLVIMTDGPPPGRVDADTPECDWSA